MITAWDLLAIDCSKVLDPVDVTAALHKLLQMDVHRQLLPWIRNFLSGHRSCIRANGVTSDWFELTSRISQGTKVMPVIFPAMGRGVAQQACMGMELLGRHRRFGGQNVNSDSTRLRVLLNKTVKPAQAA